MASVTGIARLRVLAGAAKPSPAIGQALGPLGVNMMEFCKLFNERTSQFVDTAPMRVHLTALSDRSFTFDVLSPPTTWFLKRAAGVEAGATEPGRGTVGEVSLKAVYEIAKLKQTMDPSLQGIPLPSYTRTVAQSAKSIGLKVTK